MASSACKGGTARLAWRTFGVHRVSAGCNQNLRLLCLPHPLHPLRDHRKSLPAALALVDDLFYGGKRSGTLRFLTDFLQERVHLAKNKQHLVPNAWRKKQFLIQRAMQHKRGHHIPVTRHLPQPCVLRGTDCGCHLDIVVSALRPELRGHPVAGFAHLRFPAEIIQLKNQLSISVGHLLGHGSSKSFVGWGWKIRTASPWPGFPFCHLASIDGTSNRLRWSVLRRPRRRVCE